ncbi:MAG: OmpA family protein [Bacteroidales bacterium]|nr:OmpA family protein [Bacteroidales bacterium]
MKRRLPSLTLALLLLMPAVNAVAQRFIDKNEIGFRYCWNHADLNYSHKMFDIYTHKDYWQNGFGFFITHRVSDNFAIRPEIDFIGRGANLKFEVISYIMDAKYVDLRLPLMVSFAPNAAVNPYLFVAPELGIVREGEITFKSDQTGKLTTDLAEGNISPFDVGVYGGLGVEIPISIDNFRFLVAAEAGYNLGLLNTFSEDELDGDAIVLNPSAYTFTPEGSRNNRGIEVAMTITLPLTNFSLIPKPKPRPKVVERIIEPEPEPEVEVFEYEIKDCYSFEEMYAFVKSGFDVSDKRICVFDMKFQFGSAKLLRSSEKYLDNVVGMMKAYPRMRITINGHTDNIGSEETNQTLSEKRAQSVFDYLVRHGIDANRMSCHGYGLRYPIDTNATEARRAKNRRVEIEVTRIR